MQLYISGNSPYARRARVAAREGGLMDEIDETVITSFNQLNDVGPGGKIPMLVCDDGTLLCESLIITRYLNDLAAGALLPEEANARLACLEIESVASVLMDSLFARSLENNQRKKTERSNTIYEREVARSGRCYDRLAALIDPTDERVNLGSIAVICALGYANWRAPEDQWAQGREGLNNYYERFMQRPAFAETAPAF